MNITYLLEDANSNMSNWQKFNFIDELSQSGHNFDLINVFDFESPNSINLKLESVIEIFAAFFVLQFVAKFLVFNLLHDFIISFITHFSIFIIFFGTFGNLVIILKLCLLIKPILFSEF